MFELIRANQRRAAVLTAGMGVLLLGAGYALGELLTPGGGPAGLAGGVALWAALALVAYFQGDRVFLALAGARRIEQTDHPVLFNIIEEMCIASGIARRPAVYIVDQDAPNAFATGRGPDRAAIAVTAGLLERLDRDELQGVVAHELAHVKNRDVLYLMLLGVMAGAIVILADLGRRVLYVGGGRRRTSSRSGGGAAIVLLVALALVILAPFVAQLIYFAVSRRREYLADACAAQASRFPDGLARALEKIAGGRLTAPAPPVGVRAMAPMYTVDPLAASAASWTSTHPPVEERIKILRAMGGEASLGCYQEAFRQVTRRPVGLIPFSALAAERERPAARAPQPDGQTRLDRVRGTTDLLWRLNQYVFVACGCGTRLKIPPQYAGRTLACPHCGRDQRVAPAA